MVQTAMLDTPPPQQKKELAKQLEEPPTSCTAGMQARSPKEKGKQLVLRPFALRNLVAKPC